MERKVGGISVGGMNPGPEGSKYKMCLENREFHSLNGVQSVCQEKRKDQNRWGRNIDSKLRNSKFIFGQCEGTECFCPQGRLGASSNLCL